jgi:hypothetical protein
MTNLQTTIHFLNGLSSNVTISRVPISYREALSTLPNDTVSFTQFAECIGTNCK